jgi:hypothetical protein
MGKDDIIAVKNQRELICLDCLGEHEWMNFEEEAFVTRKTAQESKRTIHCTRCKTPFVSHPNR